MRTALRTLRTAAAYVLALNVTAVAAHTAPWAGVAALCVLAPLAVWSHRWH